MASEWQLRTGCAEDLDLVEPLWVAVHYRHAETMPELAPYVSDDETWRVRRALYEELLGKEDTLLLVALVDDAAVGYGFAHVLPVDETWIPRHLGDGLADRRDRIAQCAARIPRQRARLRTSRAARDASAREWRR